MAETLQAPSQSLADACMTAASRAYVLGHLPGRCNAYMEARHASLDLLVSNLPALDASEPQVRDLQVVRECDHWAPSIVYAVGVGDTIFLDAYLEVRPGFRDVHGACNHRVHN